MLQVASILSFIFFCLGALTAHHFENYAKQQEALEQSEANREAERLAATSRAKQYETYAKRIEASTRAALVARSDADRVRESLRSISSATSETGPSAAERRLAGLLDTCTGLAEEGARHVEELSARLDF